MHRSNIYDSLKPKNYPNEQEGELWDTDTLFLDLGACYTGVPR